MILFHPNFTLHPFGDQVGHMNFQTEKVSSIFSLKISDKKHFPDLAKAISTSGGKDTNLQKSKLSEFQAT